MKSWGFWRVSPEGIVNSWAEGEGLGMWDRLPGRQHGLRKGPGMEVTQVCASVLNQPVKSQQSLPLVEIGVLSPVLPLQGDCDLCGEIEG